MKSIFFTIAIAISSILMANNISITDISLTGINTTNKTVQVRFSVSWENSWRTNVGPANWDAAWIFVKYRRGGVGDWKHAWLNNTGHLSATGSTIATGLQTPGTAFNSTTNPGIGAFVHRSANGNGTFTANNMQLQWNYGANEVTNTDLVEVKVFAIEMVYVPEGEFAAGNPDSVFSAFKLTTINTANALTDPTGVGNLGGMAGGYALSTSPISESRFKPLVSNYPNGFNAFYCMKYEITQKGYVDFLNSLTYKQQKERVATDIDSANTIVNRFVMTESSLLIYRNGIKAPNTHNRVAPLAFYCDLNNNDVPNEADDGLDLACNFISTYDGFAYLWWAGLRPMTDLEFEKGCRGNLPAVHGEYAWGTANRNTSALSSSSFVDAGTSNERLLPVLDFNQNNITTASGSGPTRVGIFATNTTNRQEAGAAYYGMMEMTGNTICATVGIHSTSSTYVLVRSYSGEHGSGYLSDDGYLPGESSWPDRGSMKPSSSANIMVSRNAWMNNVRSFQYGGRGVRSF